MKSLKYLALLLIVLPLLFACEETTSVEQVEAPVINPDGGSYTTAQVVTVTITCPTAGATIKYTTNPALADSLWPTYAGAFTVATTQTVKAKAVLTGWDDSVIVTKNFTFNYMVDVAAGTFNMGRTVGTSSFADELPVHPVSVSAFAISKYEVTQAEFEDVMGYVDATFDGDLKPVETVRWYEALIYCNKKSMNEGLIPAYTINGSTDPAVWGALPADNSATWNAVTCNWNGTGYRLPTEAEWEFAARAGVTSPDYVYSGGNEPMPFVWYEDNASEAKTVGTKQPNALGLYDMSGNVQEWVWDWYGADYYSTLSEVNPTLNPTGPASNADDIRVIRGGSWKMPASYCRIAFRNWGNMDNTETPVKVKNAWLGFRVVRSL